MQDGIQLQQHTYLLSGSCVIRKDKAAERLPQPTAVPVNHAPLLQPVRLW